MTQASAKVQAAIKSGDLVRPEACENCGVAGKGIVAHHDDYAFPLDVRWLCNSCHGLWHGANGRGKNWEYEMTIRLPAKDLDALRFLAKENERTIAAEVRLAIRDRLLLLWEARRMKDAT